MKRIDLHNTAHDQVVREAFEVLRSGGLVIFPTETVYGAGVLATSPAAVQKLLTYKARREGKPLSIAVTDLSMAEKYAEVNESARQLYARYLPGPVTVVSRGRGVVAPGVESEFGSLGIRIPAYPLVIEIVAALGLPITSTSANASGEKRPYSVDDALERLSDKQLALVDLVLDAGTLPPNPPSTVIDTTLSAPVVFRQGDVQLGDAAASTELLSHSPRETRDIAKRVLLKHWNTVKTAGLIFALNGSLGMGKTEFTKGIAEFLQISEPITSPTYTYLESYTFSRHGVGGQLHHWDWWRLENGAELSRLDFIETLTPFTVSVIEWPSQVAGQLVDAAQQKNVPIISITFADVTPANAEYRQLSIIEPGQGR
jgi:L-threonylcarbamoyladenylate synthase